MIWTPEKLEELKSFLGKIHINNIAAYFGVTKEAARWQVRKMGLTAPKPGQNRFNLLKSVSLFAKRYGHQAACEKFNLTLEQVKDMIEERNKIRFEFLNSLSTEQLIKKRKMAIQYARQRDFTEHAEDFGSYYLIQALTTGNLNSKFAFGEFLTEFYGNRNTEVGQREYTERMASVGINDAQVIQLEDTPRFDAQKEFEEAIREFGIPDELRTYFLLSYMWRMDVYEIAFIFDADLTDVEKKINTIKRFLYKYRVKNAKCLIEN